MKPGTRKSAAIEVVPQKNVVKVPPQLFDNNCMPGLVKLTPRLLKVIVGLVVCATKRYHTSRTTPVAQSGAVIVIAVSVAPNIFPGTLVQLVPDIKVTALAQRLWGSVIQILKVPIAFVVEYTLRRYVLPGIRPAATIEVVPQATEVKAAQVPEKICNCTLATVLALNVMVGLAELAVKVYHTSLKAPALQPGAGITV